MAEWKKTAKRITDEGTFIRYAADGIDCEVETWTREVPHASWSGTWTYTSYWLINPYTGQKKEFHRLSIAKKAAETLGRIHNG